MQAMAEGGHDPEFDLPRSDDEETPEFASLHDLERHLLLIPPWYDDPWSVPTEQQQQQKPPKKPHNRGVRAGWKAREDCVRRALEMAERSAQHRRRAADSKSSHPPATLGGCCLLAHQPLYLVSARQHPPSREGACQPHPTSSTLAATTWSRTRCAAPGLGNTATTVGAAARLELWRRETDREPPARRADNGLPPGTPQRSGPVPDQALSGTSRHRRPGSPSNSRPPVDPTCCGRSLSVADGSTRSASRLASHTSTKF